MFSNIFRLFGKNLDFLFVRSNIIDIIIWDFNIYVCVLLKNVFLKIFLVKFIVIYKKIFVDIFLILRFNFINIRDKKFLT